MSIDILIVDDEIDICDLVSGILSDEGYHTRSVTNGVDAIDAIRKRQPGLIILDVWLGDGSRDGLKILEIIKKDHPYVPVVMMSGHGTVETAVSAIKMGAYDFIEKPFQTDRLLLVVKHALESSKLKRENDELKIRAPSLCSLIGESHKIQNIKQQLDSNALTDSRICLYAPVGCDRTAIARYIHSLSSRSEQPFFSINCSSISPQHLESEIFGLETILNDDTPRKIGILEQAHNGSIFIDEISLLPMSAQMRFIQFLQHSEFTRVGGNQAVKVNVRIIAGSTQTEQELRTNTEFSEELFYRINVIAATIPSLSERSTDIPLLSKHFLSAISAAQNIPLKNISREALAILESYPWPGDIHQFKNVLEWSLVLAANNNSSCIDIEDLPPEIIQGNDFAKSWEQKSSTVTSLPIKEAREIFEKEYLLSQLKRFNGHISQTSKFIGMDRAALHRKLKTLGIYTDNMSED